MDAEQLGLGEIISANKQFDRDAIHIAVVPVIAGELLHAGAKVKVIDKGTTALQTDYNPVGVVDPFLTVNVRKGQRFWLFLNPGSITSLRHHWNHPKFKEVVSETIPDNSYSSTQLKSMQWLERFAEEEVRRSYNEMMQAVNDYVKNGESVIWLGLTDEFCEHYAVVTGIELNEALDDSFYSCDC